MASLQRAVFQGCIISLALAGPAYGLNFDANAKIVLASLLGGIPAVALLMLGSFYIWLYRRKKYLREQALIHGIELDETGWPVRPIPSEDPALINAARTTPAPALTMAQADKVPTTLPEPLKYDAPHSGQAV